MPEFRGPDWRRFVRTHVRLPQMARHREERVLAELADHLEDVYRDARSRGTGEDEARARAERRLGDPDLAIRELLDGDPSRLRTALHHRADQTEATLRDGGGGWVPVADLLRDLRQSLRTLSRRPAFTAAAVLTMALGIGANTAVFSVLNSVVLAPLPYDEPDQLVRLYSASQATPEDRQFLTGPDILDITDEVEAFASVGILYTYREIGRDLTTGGQPQRVRVLQVGAGYFDTYRVTPLLGRVFTPDEERADVRRVILSHSLWSAYAGRDPDVVGQTLRLDGEAYEVIGVMRPTFRDVTVGEVTAWVPEDIERARNQNRGNHYLSAIARLHPQVTVAQAQAQVDAVMTRLARDFPDTNETKLTRVIPLHDDVVGGSAVAVYVLMGAAGLVLLIACLNVGNLFLVRAITQGRDSAIRAALGAARSRVMGQRLLECVLVAGFGGVIGAVVAHWGVRFLLAVSPSRWRVPRTWVSTPGYSPSPSSSPRAPACSSVSARPTARHGRTRAWPCTTALAGRRLGVVAVTRAPRSSWPRWPLRSCCWSAPAC